MRKDKRERREYFNKRRQERIQFIRDYKSDKQCAYCGYCEHTEILQFHHVDPTTKKFDFSGSEIGNLSMERIKNEIQKCILLCPNCHQWLHFSEKQTINE